MLKKLLSKQNKALLLELVRTDFKLRYQGSSIGYAWSLLRPLLMFLILYLVFGVIFKVGNAIPSFAIYLFLGIVLWSFFSEMTSQSLTSIVARGDLIRKIRIPRWMVVVSSSIGALINFALNLIVVVIFALITGMDFMFSAVYLPLFIIEVYLFSLGVSLLLSTLYVKYRDIGHIWEVVLQAGFYATPILYPLSLVTNDLAQKAIMLNPMAHAIQGARDTFVTAEAQTTTEIWGTNLATLFPIGITLLVLVVGVGYFKKEAKYFAENV